MATLVFTETPPRIVSLVKSEAQMADSQDHLLDKRIVQRNIQKGLVGRKDYQSHLEGLADSEHKAETIDLGGEADEAEESAPPAATPEASE